MIEVIALQEYSDKIISLYEGEIRNIEENLAYDLIRRKIVALHADSEGGGSSNFTNIIEGKTEGSFRTSKTVSEDQSYSLGEGAVALGEGTKALNRNQVVLGRYNIEDTNNDYALIVGNGIENSPSNAFAVKWNGSLVINDTQITPSVIEQIVKNNIFNIRIKNGYLYSINGKTGDSGDLASQVSRRLQLGQTPRLLASEMNSTVPAYILNAYWGGEAQDDQGVSALRFTYTESQYNTGYGEAYNTKDYQFKVIEHIIDIYVDQRGCPVHEHTVEIYKQ